jgi:hemerythrin-like domain-containing protein
MVEKHQLILRMTALLEKNVALAEVDRFSDWSFLEGALPFIMDFTDLFHHAVRNVPKSVQLKKLPRCLIELHQSN